MLEAEGWTVWWDTSLAIGDDFRNGIMTELGRARAVIVIWTDASIKSDWVRSEAGRAQADRKLIPIKLEHLTYKDLPPPFDVLHTENVGEDDKVRAAVVAQLAKPAVEPSAVALLTKGFKYEVLTWVGIVGGALTLFTHMSSVLKLADWAQLLVQHWQEWTYVFWAWAFSWLGIELLEEEWPPVLSFLLFGSILAIGQAVKFTSTLQNQPSVDRYQEKSFKLISWRTLFCFVSILASSLTVPFINAYPLSWLFQKYGSFLTYEIRVNGDFVAGGPTSLGYLLNSLPLIAWVLVPQLVVALFARHKLYAASSAFLIGIFSTIIVFSPLNDMGASEAALVLIFLTLPLAWVLPLILLSVAPAKAVARRLIFLALGLLLLIALNALSKFGLDLTAPKLQG
jgi:hypothetical protein